MKKMAETIDKGGRNILILHFKRLIIYMKGEKEAKISYWAHHLTTVVSVTLVLVLAGIIALIWIGADTETRRLKEKIELSVIVADSLPTAKINELAAFVRKQPYARDVRVISSEEALKAWKEDTGEDLQELFGVNPLNAEISFGVNADYASAAKIRGIVRQLESRPGVDTVSSPDNEMIDSMNENIRHITIILSVIAAIMLVISFVLINNTVHLTVYSRRFTIHTMQLVGATNGFIRRPIVLDNMLAGLLAGVLASAILAIALVSAANAGMPDLADFIGWGAFGIVAGGLTLTGVCLCLLASACSANIYLRKDYDSLFH